MELNLIKFLIILWNSGVQKWSHFGPPKWAPNGPPGGPVLSQNPLNSLCFRSSGLPGRGPFWVTFGAHFGDHFLARPPFPSGILKGIWYISMHFLNGFIHLGRPAGWQKPSFLLVFVLGTKGEQKSPPWDRPNPILWRFTVVLERGLKEIKIIKEFKRTKKMNSC